MLSCQKSQMDNIRVLIGDDFISCENSERKEVNDGSFEWEINNKSIVLSIVDYYWKNYKPKELRKDHFSRSRVTKLVYLTDWYYALKSDECKPLTTIPWYFDEYGPYVDLTDMLASNYRVVPPEYEYARKRTFVPVGGWNEEDVQQRMDLLDRIVIGVCNNIIDETHSMSYLTFLNYIYATLPVVRSRRYTKLNLEYFAKEEKKEHLNGND